MSKETGPFFSARRRALLFGLSPRSFDNRSSSSRRDSGDRSRWCGTNEANKSNAGREPRGAHCRRDHLWFAPFLSPVSPLSACCCFEFPFCFAPLAPSFFFRLGEFPRLRGSAAARRCLHREGTEGIRENLHEPPCLPLLPLRGRSPVQARQCLSRGPSPPGRVRAFCRRLPSRLRSGAPFLSRLSSFASRRHCCRASCGCCAAAFVR